MGNASEGCGRAGRGCAGAAANAHPLHNVLQLALHALVIRQVQNADAVAVCPEYVQQVPAMLCTEDQIGEHHLVVVFVHENGIERLSF